MGLPLTVATFCANDGRATIAVMANNRRAGFTIIYSILSKTGGGDPVVNTKCRRGDENRRAKPPALQCYCTFAFLTISS
jgi:hypothetical protein